MSLKKDRQRSFYLGAELAVDFLIWLMSSIIAYLLRHHSVDLPLNYFLATIIVALIFSILLFLIKPHDSESTPFLKFRYDSVFVSWSVSAVIFLVLIVFSKISSEFSRIWITLWFIFSLTGLLSIRSLFQLVIRRSLLNKKYVKNVLLIYRNQLIANDLINETESSQLGYVITTTTNVKKIDRRAGIPKLNLCNQVDDSGIYEVWICLPLKDGDLIEVILNELKFSTVEIRYFPDFDDLSLLNHKITKIAGHFALDLSCSPITGIDIYIKRLEDIIVSVAALLFFLPLFPIIALLINFTSRGPVLYRQTRYGLGGKKIQIYKFRTMIVHTEKDNTLTQAKKNDRRITYIGKFLRKTSLDELPQLINVLTGSMSIVGPRPHASIHNEYYKSLVEKYMWRHKVKPGITGWAQILGLRGETDTIEKMEARVKADLWYLENWSLFLDLKIIFWTLFRGFYHKNAV